MLSFVVGNVGSACLVFGAFMSILFGVLGPRVIGGRALSTLPWPERVMEFWLNFAGVAAGWVIMYSYLTRATLGSIGFADLVLMLAGFIGIIGYLPAAVVPSALGLGFTVREWVAARLQQGRTAQPNEPKQ